MREIPTRALSILQPWAHAIVHLGKRIENRAWRNGCDFRGEILIHASKGVGSIDAFDSAVEAVRDAVMSRDGEEQWMDLREVIDQGEDMRWRPSDLLMRGGIVGRARIAGVVDNKRCNNRWRARIGAPTFADTRDLTPEEHAWWTGGFALVLADVEPLPFVPCPGALGLWTVPPPVRAAIAVEVARG